MNKKNFKNEIIKINQIDKLSDSLFGHLAPDEIDSLGIEFEETTTRMLQVVVIKTKYVMAMDLFEDLEFKPLLNENPSATRTSSSLFMSNIES